MISAPYCSRNEIRLLTLFFFYLLGSSLTAQRLPKAETLTVDDGLGFRDVTAIAQDAQGLMWFGTRQGLSRYDGYRFTRFGNGSQADKFLPGEDILLNSMVLANDTTLWLVIDKRLHALHLPDYTCRDISAGSGIGGAVCQLNRAKDGSIWLVWEDAHRQYLCHSEKGAAFREIASVGRLRREFTHLATDTTGNAWWSTITAGLRQYSPQGALLHEARPDSFVWYGTTMYATPVFVDSRNRVFILPKSKNQIWLYDPVARHVAIMADSLPSVAYHALEDSRGHIWFATKDRLLRLAPDDVWTDYSSVLKTALPYSSIQALYEDRTNMLWVATDNGLLKLPIQKQLFQRYFNVPGLKWGNAMRSIFEDKSGRIYGYCENGAIGLHRVDPLAGTTVLLPLSGGAGKGSKLLEQAMHFVADPTDDVAWTLTNQLIKIDLRTLRLTPIADFPEVANKLSHNPLALLRNGTFLLGGFLDRLTIFNPRTGAQTRLLPAPSTHFQTVATEAFLENEDGSLWVATATAGLYRFSRSGQVLQHLSADSKPALSNNHLLALHRAADGLLWIGTFGGGLNCLDPHTGAVRIFTRREGLPDDNVTGILSDAAGNVWVSTYNGLACYSSKQGTFQNFFEEDGLSSNEFNYTSFFKDSRGRLWFGGMNGVHVFSPADLLQSHLNPPLCFTGFSKYNRRRDSLETRLLGSRFLEPVTISPYDSYFQFNWILPNYFKPDKNQYYVWLEGFESDWSFIGNIALVRYNKLPAGHYVLHIKGADSKGNWSEAELAVAIHVLPFYYQTWWFMLLCALLLVGVVYAVARYRIQQQLAMERMRTRIAGDLHDEVGSMLSGLSMQAEMLELDQNKIDSGRLRHISDISRLALSKMRDVVWAIDSRRDLVKDLLDRMREHAEEMLAPRDIAFEFQLGELPLEKKLPVDQRQHLFLFFKEAITNVVKHAAASTVTIRFGNFGQHFELSVRDNGTSVAPSTASTGLGLQNMELRARQLGAVLHIRRENGFLVSMRMKAL